MKLRFRLNRFIAALLIIMLLPVMSIQSSATLIDTNNIITDLKDNIEIEEKYVCNATIEDNFLEDSILVLMKKDVNLDSSKLKSTYFPEVQIKSIDSLTKRTDALVRNIRQITNNNTSLMALSDTKKSQKLQELSVSTGYSVADLKKMGEDFSQIIELKLENPGKQNVLDTIKELEKREDVIAAEPNYIYSSGSSSSYGYSDVVHDSSAGTTELDNFPRGDFSRQWAIDKIDLEKAWEITTGSQNVFVGVLDTGINTLHPDLEDNMCLDCANDFTGGGNTDIDPVVLDEQIGHGTYIAGIIGAKGDSNSRITGVCKNIRLVNLRVRNEQDQTTAGSYINAIMYAHDIMLPIINFSGHASDGADTGDGVNDFKFGSETLKGAIQNYFGLFVCAAGNQGDELGLGDGDIQGYPTCFQFSKDYDNDGELDGDNIISVAATDENDGLWEYSNYGSRVVDLGAPGVQILSTSADREIGYVIGTSYAAPYVVGVAALLKSKYPNLTTNQLKNRILNTVDRVSSLTYTSVMGGRLNAYSALRCGDPYYKITYDANGGTGVMADTRAFWGDEREIRSNAYTKNDYSFSHWYAKRNKDNKWYYQNSAKTQSGWYLEGVQPSGWTKYRFEDNATVYNLSDILESDSQNSIQYITETSTLTFYAQWTPSYTIVYDANGGTGTMESDTAVCGTDANLRENTFTRAGYSFSGWTAKRSSDNKWIYINTDIADTDWYIEGQQPEGWYKYICEDGESVTEPSNVAGDVVTFYAQWAPSYTIVYDANGGTGTMENTIATYGVEAPLRDNEFIRHGYKFAAWLAKRNVDNKWLYSNTNASQKGWYIEGQQPEGWEKYAFSEYDWVTDLESTPGATVTLYAKWTPNYYTIVYDANGGTGTMESDTAVCGTDANLRENTFTRAGYSFSGWTAKRSSDNKWIYINVDIPDTDWYIEGQQPEGWYKYICEDGESVTEPSNITGDVVTFYAQWTPSYTIVYDANGGTGTMENTIATYGVEAPLRDNEFIRHGYKFTAWLAKRNVDNKWLYSNTNASQTGWYIEGQEPEGWEKYEFSEYDWVTDLESTPGAIVTLYAKWTPNYYTIVYDANGGTGTMESDIAVCGTDAQLRDNTFTQDGYVFSGWTVKRSSDNKWLYYNSITPDSEWYLEGQQPEDYEKYICGDGESITKPSNIPEDSITLYAQWEQGYTIVYNRNGGRGNMQNTYALYGIETHLRANTFIRNDYIFVGWNVKRNSDSKWLYFNTNTSETGWYTDGQQPEYWEKFMYDDGADVTYLENAPGTTITFYAQWKRGYLIQFDSNGGEGTMSDVYAYLIEDLYADPIQLPACTFAKEGYVFGGWYAYDLDYDYWAYGYGPDAEYYEWLIEEDEEYGYCKYVFQDQSYFDATNDKLTSYVFYAIWLEL